MTEAAVRAIAKAAHDAETIRRDLVDAGLTTLAQSVDALRYQLVQDHNEALRQLVRERVEKARRLR